MLCGGKAPPAIHQITPGRYPKIDGYRLMGCPDSGRLGDRKGQQYCYLCAIRRGRDSVGQVLDCGSTLHCALVSAGSTNVV